MNIILRAVFNRPEMLQLSFEYEIAARKHFMLPGKYVTIFIVEYGSPQKTLELVENYPFKARHIVRSEKYGLSKNILEGMKDAFKSADDHVIYIEDDILIHKTYFQYMDILLNMFSKDEYSILSPYNGDDGGRISEFFKGDHYAALAPLINKEFFEMYVEPCITSVYYENFGTRDKFITVLNNKYKDYWGKGYRYGANRAHNEQAGLISRLQNVAMIEENRCMIQPYVNRQMHAGFYGKNRPGGIIPGKNFEEKLKNLREIIKDANEMYKLSATKQYNDYRTFSSKLEEWDGTLRHVKK
jgi:hypothetical protein